MNNQIRVAILGYGNLGRGGYEFGMKLQALHKGGRVTVVGERILVEEARALNLNVWSYSGWTYEELLASGDPARVSHLCSLDVLVDGRFVLEERSLSLPWRGSRNQRLVDVQKSLSEGRVCLWEQPVVSWDAL